MMVRSTILALAVLFATFPLSAKDELPWSERIPSESERALTLLTKGTATRLWTIEGGRSKLQIVEDEILGRPVLDSVTRSVIRGNFSVLPDTEISFRTRLATTEKTRSSSLTVNITNNIKDPKAVALNLHLTGSYDRNTGCSVKPDPAARFQLQYKPYPSISPALEESIRVPLERAMSQARMSQDRWTAVRIAIEEDTMRVWVDDRLIWTRQGDLRLDGSVLRLTLAPLARITDLTIQPLNETPPGFETIRLDGYVNESSLLHRRKTQVDRNALPFGKEVLIGDIPVRFADRSDNEGNDHIDLSQSYCRQAKWPGYHSSRLQRMAGATYVDPARIQLRIPNGRYDAMYVVAGFDDRKNHVPILSASFYRPCAGFPMIFETEVPSVTTKESDARRIPVRLVNGKRANLWLVKIPLRPEMLASFSDIDIIEVELTKKMHQYRSYPDPYIYGWHQGGLPSGVHVYAITLHRPDVEMSIDPAIFGHVWQSTSRPKYNVTLTNRGSKRTTVTLTANSTSYDGAETTSTQSRKVALNPGKSTKTSFSFSMKKHGIHAVSITMKHGDLEWTEKRNLCRLAPDTRPAKYEEGKGPLFGYWSYHGGHYTAPADEIVRLMALAGARGAMHKPRVSEDTEKNIFEKKGFLFGPDAWPVSPQWAWAGEEKLDQKKVAEYKKSIIEKIRSRQGDNPRLISFFPEPHISRNLTAGNLPSYWGEPEYGLNAKEQKSLRVFFNTSKIAAEAVRATWPKATILIPWGDPLFIVPLLRAGFPKELIDGSALDMIGFERLPEQQIHQQSTHRLYMLKKEYEKFGMQDPMLPYVEGLFVPTEPGAVTWQEQAERYHRWSLISLAYGITEFYSGWFAFDCGNYYGSEHYGGCGIQRRIPYNDPKPAYAHFATMTRHLSAAKYESWLPTGSLTVYCLRFSRSKDGPVYTAWTVRGTRPATLLLENDATVSVTDSMDNALVIKSKDKQITITLGTSPTYITGATISGITLGKPNHTNSVAWSRGRNKDTWGHGPLTDRDTPEIQHSLVIGNLGDGSWSNTDEKDDIYESNNYDTMRYRGKMSVQVVEDDGREGLCLAVKLGTQDTEHKLMPWYTVIRPDRPIEIPGKGKALGMWVKAQSDWGRIVYCLRDAKGDRWISIGSKDEWNCDDMHSWSSFNFDGWRYLRFELPSNLPYDSFREYGTTWWRYSGQDDIVDLPLTIEKIIVERRTHVLYVNDIQPTDAENKDVLLADLIVEYNSTDDATAHAVKLSRIRMPISDKGIKLDNPMDRMADENDLPATKLKGVRDPDWGYDGTKCHVDFEEVAGAKQYQIWVAARKSGAGAQRMGRFTKSGQLLRGLRSATKFYLWVTYTDKDKKQSKPSNRIEIQLVDAFGMK